MSDPSGRYVPAAGRAAFTRLYDPLMALSMRERNWRPALIEQVCAALPEGGIVVDVGAGTGTLATALGQARPDAHVIAIDGDPDALAIAGRKPGAERVRWVQGLAGELPVGDGQADAVLMSLLLHHLDADAKRAALAEARRALANGAELHVADWGRPAGMLPRAGFLALRLVDGFGGTREHAAGRLPTLIASAGFLEPRIWKRLSTAWGHLELMSAAARRRAS